MCLATLRLLCPARQGRHVWAGKRLSRHDRRLHPRYTKSAPTRNISIWSMQLLLASLASCYRASSINAQTPFDGLVSAGDCIIANSITDLTQPHWRLSWLIVGAGGSLMAILCAATLYFDGAGRAAGIATSAALILYCAYLFRLPCRCRLAGIHYWGVELSCSHSLRFVSGEAESEARIGTVVEVC